MSSTASITRLRVSDLMRAIWPRHTAKHAASASGLSIRTAQAWLAERCTPSAATLLLMARRNDALRLELIRQLAEPADDSTSQMDLPLDGAAMDTARDQRHQPGDDLAAEG